MGKTIVKDYDYKSLDTETKSNYLAFVQSMIDNQDPYHIDMMKLVEEYSTLELTIESASSDKDVRKEKDRRSAVVEELEEIGVVTEEKNVKIKGLNGKYVIDIELDHLKSVWKSQLGGNS